MPQEKELTPWKFLFLSGDSNQPLMSVFGHHNPAPVALIKNKRGGERGGLEECQRGS